MKMELDNNISQIHDIFEYVYTVECIRVQNKLEILTLSTNEEAKNIETSKTEQKHD